MYKNYTELVDKEGGEKILEVGPGKFIYPFISLNHKDYAILDAAKDEEDADKKFMQYGGLETFKSLASIYVDISKLKEYNMFAHDVDKINENFDSILNVKSLSRIDFTHFIGLIAEKYGINNESIKNVYAVRNWLKDMNLSKEFEEEPFVYTLMLFDKYANKTKKIIIIPSSDRYVEIFEELGKNIGISRIFNVEEPVWTYKNEKFYHWQFPYPKRVLILSEFFEKDKRRENIRNYLSNREMRKYLEKTEIYPIYLNSRDKEIIKKYLSGKNGF